MEDVPRLILTCDLPNSDALCVFILVTIAPNGTIQLATPGSEGLQGLQTLTMANSGAAQQGTTILQYAQTPDGQQILVPSNQVVVQGKTWSGLSTPILSANVVIVFGLGLHQEAKWVRG